MSHTKLPFLYTCTLVTQLCPTLCDRMDCSLPDSSVCKILQARILAWLPFPSPEDLPNPGIEPKSPAWQADSLPSELPGKPSVLYSRSIFDIYFMYIVVCICQPQSPSLYHTLYPLVTISLFSTAVNLFLFCR